MKLNGPVACRGFFKGQIKAKRQGLWCVTLQPNGWIQGLIEASSASEQGFHWTLETIRHMLAPPHVTQVLLVHIDLESTLFTDFDWMILEKVQSLLEQEDCQLCDYLKLTENSVTSLIRFDY